jgi:hypothetical protein
VARPSQARIAPPFGSVCDSANRNLRPRGVRQDRSHLSLPNGPLAGPLGAFGQGSTMDRV